MPVASGTLRVEQYHHPHEDDGDDDDDDEGGWITTSTMNGREFRDVITASLDEREDTCAFEKQWKKERDGVASCNVFSSNGNLEMKFRAKGSTRDEEWLDHWDDDTARCGKRKGFEGRIVEGNRCNFHGHEEEERTTDNSPHYPWFGRPQYE